MTLQGTLYDAGLAKMGLFDPRTGVKKLRVGFRPALRFRARMIATRLKSLGTGAVRKAIGKARRTGDA